MSAFVILSKDFGPTWKKIEPYVNYIGPVRVKEWQKLLKVAQKAVYIFICSSLNKGFFEVGLNTQIKALDHEKDINGDAESSYYSRQMNKAIEEALNAIRRSSQQGIDRNFIAGQIQSIYVLADSFMKKEIGSGYLLCAKTFSPCC